MKRLTIFMLLVCISAICRADECSTNLSDCFKTISNLEAGDSRLQKYEIESKKFLKNLNHYSKIEGLSFDNKSVLLKGWTVLDRAALSGRYAVLLKNESGKKYVFTWSEEGEGLNPDITKDCSEDESTEFLTGEVYTSRKISENIVVVRECGVKKVFDAVKKK